MLRKSVANEVDALPTYYHVTNGAALVTDPATAKFWPWLAVKIILTAKSTVTLILPPALRQPGSSIKPINYAVGLIKGYNAATTFIDQPICFPNQGGQNYCPVNYDGKWHGLSANALRSGQFF